LSRILSGQLAEANKHANALAAKLEQSEKARKKAEADAAAVEDLRKRLHDAETSLSENISEQSARETEILSRLESQCRRFVSKYFDPCCFSRVTSHFPSMLFTSYPLFCLQGELIKTMRWMVL
jgi:DNA repair exonuclease SbcCD ATPase subunit